MSHLLPRRIPHMLEWTILDAIPERFAPMPLLEQGGIWRRRHGG